MNDRENPNPEINDATEIRQRAINIQDPKTQEEIYIVRAAIISIESQLGIPSTEDWAGQFARGAVTQPENIHDETLINNLKDQLNILRAKIKGK